MMKQIHKCANFIVNYTERQSDKIIVTFDHFNEKKTNFSKPRSSLYGFDDYSHLHISSKINDWYTSSGREQLLSTCGPVIKKYDSSVCFGNSMGGHAAIQFGAFFKSNRIVAVSPRIQLDPDQAPFDSRNLSHIKKADFLRGDLRLLGDQRIDTVIVYDPFSKFDAAHVKIFKKHFPQWQYLAFPFGGHPALAGAKSTSTIPVLARALAEGQESLADVLKIYKSVRRQSPYYWHHHLSHPRYRAAIVRTAAQVMEWHTDTTKSMLFSLGDKLVKAGEYDYGLPILRKAFYLTLSPPSWWAKRLAMREVQYIKHVERRRNNTLARSGSQLEVGYESIPVAAQPIMPPPSRTLLSKIGLIFAWNQRPNN